MCSKIIVSVIILMSFLLSGCGQDRPSTAAEKEAAKAWVECMNHPQWQKIPDGTKRAILMRRMCGRQPKYGMDY